MTTEATFLGTTTGASSGDTMTPMLRTDTDLVLDDILCTRRLLTHTFYRRWEAGTLERSELASYAAQYRHFEATLPTVLESVASRLPDGRARELVEANLHDERSVPAPHVTMFDDFARSVGARATAMSPATAILVERYLSLADASPSSGLAAVAAYEVQAPAIATSKAEGLRRRYGLDASATRFWDVHAEVDTVHGDWTLEALALVADDPAEVTAAATAAADAWWSFLDERQAEAPVPAPC
jgi:pyrroloquinoline quinone (PQQ) biosynthesis protein C